MATKTQIKKQLILDSAIKVFALKGYQYATVDDIAKDAGIAKGSVHAYFENKLDVYLTIMLLFWQTINKANSRKISHLSNPLEILKTIFETFQDILLHDKESLYWGKILRDGPPEIHCIKNEKLQKKQVEINRERQKLMHTIDNMIRRAQKQRLIKKDIKYQVIRQVLGGASQLLVYGLFMKFSRGQGIGYDDNDVRKVMRFLIDSFSL